MTVGGWAGVVGGGVSREQAMLMIKINPSANILFILSPYDSGLQFPGKVSV